MNTDRLVPLGSGLAAGHGIGNKAALLVRAAGAGLPSSEHPSEDRLRGVGLTRGAARGRTWVLRESSMELPEGFSPDSTILVARSVDAGWVPTFSRVAGVVVETGGDLSHGSIILREMGLPAITNASRATRAFETGDELVLRADTGTVARSGG